MLVVFAAAAGAATAVSEPPAVEAVEVTVRAPVVGTLQLGVQAYRPEFFTQVRPGTAFDMVQWLPGFTFEETRDMRGLSGAAGNVLIDGQPPTSKNDTLATVLRRIPATQVERVDIIVGAAAGIDMRGRSVIANVVLKKSGAPPGSATASMQLFEHGIVAPELQANVTRLSGDTTTEASATLARRQLQDLAMGRGTLERRDPTGAREFLADSDIDGVMLFGSASAGHQFPWAGGKLKLNVSGIYQNVEARERADLAGQPSIYTIDNEDRYRQAELGARFERSLGRFKLETQALQRLNGHRQSTVLSALRW